MSPFRALWRRIRARYDRRSLESLLADGFVAIDLETTGLDPRRDAIVEIAAVPFVAGRPGRGFVTHVNPERAIPLESVRVHGITDDAVAGAPTIGSALVNLETVCADRVLVGHGLAFDLAVLERARRAHRRAPLANLAFDTKWLAIALHPDWRRMELHDMAARLSIGVLGRHTAEGDARAAGELFLALLVEAGAAGVRTLGELLRFQEGVGRRA